MADNCGSLDPLGGGVFYHVSSGIERVDTIAHASMTRLATALSGLNTAASHAVSALRSDFEVEATPPVEGDYVSVPFTEAYDGEVLQIPGVLEASIENGFTPTPPPTFNEGLPATYTPNFGQGPGAAPQYTSDSGTSGVGSAPPSITLDPPAVVPYHPVANITHTPDEPAYPEFSGFSFPSAPPAPDLSAPTAPTAPTLSAIDYPNAVPALTTPVVPGVPILPALETVTAPTLDVQTLPSAPTLSLPALPSAPSLNLPTFPDAPSLYEAQDVLITDPDVSAILARFDNIAGRASVPPDLTYTPPDFDWLLARLNAVLRPEAPDIAIETPDFSAVQAVSTALTNLTLDRPTLAFTPVDLTVTTEVPNIDLSGIQTAAATLSSVADDIVGKIAQARADFLSGNDAYLDAQGLDAIQGALNARLFDMLDADSDRIGLPAAVEDALRARAFAALDRETRQLERQALTEWLARGFTLPGGVLDAQIMGVRRAALDKKSDVSRDVFVESAKLKIDVLRDAIKTGLDYEFRYREIALKADELALRAVEARIAAYKSVIDALSEAAKTQLAIWQGLLQLDELRAKIVQIRADVERAVLDGQVALYKADADVIGVRAATLGELVKIGLAQIEADKIRVSALIDQYKAATAMYAAEVDAVRSLVALPSLEADLEKARLAAEADIYRARSDGWKAELQALPDVVRAEIAKVDASKARVDVERVRVEASALGVQAYQAETEAAKAEVGLEGLKVDVYRAETEAAKTATGLESLRVDIYRAQMDAAKLESERNALAVQAYQSAIDLEKARMTLAGLYVQMYQAQVELVRAQVAGDTAQVQVFQSRVELAKAQIAGEEAKIAGFKADTERYRAAIELEASRTSLYATQIEAMKAGIQGETAKANIYAGDVDIAKAKVALEGTKLDAKRLLMDSEKLWVESDSLKTQQHGSQTQLQQARGALYGAEVQKYAAEIELAGQEIERLKASISRFSAEIQGYAAAQQGYATEMEGEKIRASIYATGIQGYAERVRVAGLEADLWKTKETLAIETEKQRQQTLIAQMQAAQTFVQQQIENNRNALMAYQVGVDRYKAEVENNKIAADVATTNSNLTAQNSLKELQIKAQKAEHTLSKAIEMSRTLIGVYESLSRAEAQTVAGAMSALNMSAQISSGSSISDSKSCGTSYQYSM